MSRKSAQFSNFLSFFLAEFSKNVQKTSLSYEPNDQPGLTRKENKLKLRDFKMSVSFRSSVYGH